MQNINKRIILRLAPLFFLFYFCLNLYTQSYSIEKSNKVDLEKILVRTREYCHRLDSAVFDFVCIEEIVEKKDIDFWGLPYELYDEPGWNFRIRSGKLINKYIYDYQFIRKGGSPEERRILLEENGRKRYEENAELKHIRFYYKNVIFGPIGLLSEFRQFHHDYKIVKDEILDEQETVVIEAIPKSSLKRGHLYGKIWVRKSDFNILKIEWDQKSLPRYQQLEKLAEEMKSEAKITLISEYSFEKNGIRFPGRYFIEEAYINKKGEKKIISEIDIIYRDYKFFTVETKIKH